MVTHQDDRPFEPFIANMGAGDKKVTLKRGYGMCIAAALRP